MSFMGKHTIQLRRLTSSIPLAGFWLRVRHVIASFELFEQQQLPRLLGLMSQLSSEQVRLTQMLSRQSPPPPTSVPASVLLRTPEKFAQALHRPVRIQWGPSSDTAINTSFLSISEQLIDDVDVVAALDAWPFTAGSVDTIAVTPDAWTAYNEDYLRQQVLPALFSKLKAGGQLSWSVPAALVSSDQPHWLVSAFGDLGLTGIVWQAGSGQEAHETLWQLRAHKPELN